MIYLQRAVAGSAGEAVTMCDQAKLLAIPLADRLQLLGGATHDVDLRSSGRKEASR